MDDDGRKHDHAKSCDNHKDGNGDGVDADNKTNSEKTDTNRQATKYVNNGTNASRHIITTMLNKRSTGEHEAEEKSLESRKQQCIIRSSDWHARGDGHAPTSPVESEHAGLTARISRASNLNPPIQTALRLTPFPIPSLHPRGSIAEELDGQSDHYDNYDYCDHYDHYEKS